MNNAISMYKKYLRKYNLSIVVYNFISILSFILSAILIILNLFAIKFNPGNTASSLPGTANPDNYHIEFLIFVSISIIAAVQGIITALISLFTFKKKITLQRDNSKLIAKQIKLYNNDKDIYNDKTTKDWKLIMAVKDIIESN